MCGVFLVFCVIAVSIIAYTVSTTQVLSICQHVHLTQEEQMLLFHNPGF